MVDPSLGCDQATWADFSHNTGSRAQLSPGQAKPPVIYYPTHEFRHRDDGLPE